MSAELQSAELERKRKMRSWPMWWILALQVFTLVFTVTPAIANSTRFGSMMLGPLVCVLLFLIWLLFASRMDWQLRLGTLAVTILPAIVVAQFIESSMGIMLWIYGAPFAIAIAFLVNYFTQNWSNLPRLGLVGLLMTLMWCGFLMFRLDGFDGAYFPELASRWKPSVESTLPTTMNLNSRSDEVAAIDFQGITPTWPQFRGPKANGQADLDTPLDWSSKAPDELWRISVGPAWSSFTLVADRLFTQEQRGEEELVACYNADSGQPIWQHKVRNRFEDVVAGAGPRATPTFADGRLFTFGSKAVLCAIDPSTGEQLWQRDLMKEVNAQVPVWGFSGSPVVLGDVVMVYAGGDAPYGLCAFNAETGESVWQIASSGMNFSSVEMIKIGDEQFALFGDSNGLMAIYPESGEVAWEYTPDEWKGPAIVQPQQIGPHSLIVPLGDGVGVARLEVEKSGDDWEVIESWSSRKLRPSFNDFVYHDGHLYGFDQHIFVCIDADDGKRKWKKGRYGFGQVVLLPKVAQLVVATEQGEVVLLEANPEKHVELGRVKVGEGKTWNHPIVANDRLFWRNGKAAVCLNLLAE